MNPTNFIKRLWAKHVNATLRKFGAFIVRWLESPKSTYAFALMALGMALADGFFFGGEDVQGHIVAAILFFLLGRQEQSGLEKDERIEDLEAVIAAPNDNGDKRSD